MTQTFSIWRSVDLVNLKRGRNEKNPTSIIAELSANSPRLVGGVAGFASSELGNSGILFQASVDRRAVIILMRLSQTGRCWENEFQLFAPQKKYIFRRFKKGRSWSRIVCLFLVFCCFIYPFLWWNETLKSVSKKKL